MDLSAPPDPDPGPWRRDPAGVLGLGPDGPHDPATRFCALACLVYADVDEPARWAAAAEVLAAHPDVRRRSIHAAAALGDGEAVAEHLRRDPAAATVEGGPFRWPPLLYLCYGRVAQPDPVGTLDRLLDAGADPDAGYLWCGLTPPFTALTGVFGEGEQGPGRQPRHPEWSALARRLLHAGADPNDAQTLYNRMFGRDDSHLELLLAHGLGRGDGGVWRRRLGDALETVPEMLQRQVAWAAAHGFSRRLALLAEHGWVASDPGRGPDGGPDGGTDGGTEGGPVSVHRVGTPEAASAAVTGGADVDEYREGRTALHHAAWMGDVAMVEALLVAGADPTLLDHEHHATAAQWADHGHQPAAAALLRARGW